MDPARRLERTVAEGRPLLEVERRKGEEKEMTTTMKIERKMWAYGTSRSMSRSQGRAARRSGVREERTMIRNHGSKVSREGPKKVIKKPQENFERKPQENKQEISKSEVVQNHCCSALAVSVYISRQRVVV